MNKRSDGRWQQAVTVNGKRVYVYGKTKAECMAKYAEYVSHNTGDRIVSVGFDKVANMWAEEKAERVAWNTIHAYISYKNKAIKEFGSVDIDLITPRMISLFYKKLSKTLSRKTLASQHGVLHLIFRYAVEEGFCGSDPTRDIFIPDGGERKKILPPNEEEIRIIKSHTDTQVERIMYFALYTGLRKGELFALTWDDIDLENRTISVNKALYWVGNYASVKPPKTDASLAEVPILDALYPLLVKMREERIGDLVFPNEEGKYITATGYTAMIKKYNRDRGVDVQLHQLRHAYATMLFEAGIPIDEAQVLMRHSDYGTTKRVYTALRDGKREAIFKKVRAVDIE